MKIRLKILGTRNGLIAAVIGVSTIFILRRNSDAIFGMFKYIGRGLGMRE